MKLKSIAGTACAGLICTASGIAQAGTITNENFDSGASGWTNNTTSVIGGHTILGGYGVLSIATLSKNFTLAPGPSEVTIDFDFFRIDSWDNEYFDVVASGEVLVHDLYDFSSGTNIGGAPFNDEIIHYSLTYYADTTDLQLNFSAALNQSSTDESWGIDNLVITQTVSAVPVPAAAWLFGSGLLGLIGVARRKGVS